MQRSFCESRIRSGAGPSHRKGETLGSCRRRYIEIALDTGATITTVNAGVLIAMGYDPEAVPDRVRLITGSGIESAPRVLVKKATFLGQQRLSFAVLAHTLPSTAGVDGLLGLDCLRNRRLLLDFLKGQIRLT